MDLRGLVFARGQNGSISSRLVTMQSELGRIVELSGAGNRVAGLFPGQFFHAEVAALAPGTLGGSYRDTLHLRAQGGAPRVWSIERGTLPPGLTLTSEGMIQGIPTQVGTFAFTLRTDQGAFAFFSEGTITVITAEQIVDALVGSQPLPQAVATALDQRGNLNGELDVGDLRAYLRAQGRVLSPILRALVASPN